MPLGEALALKSAYQAWSNDIRANDLHVLLDYDVQFEDRDQAVIVQFSHRPFGTSPNTSLTYSVEKTSGVPTRISHQPLGGYPLIPPPLSGFEAAAIIASILTRDSLGPERRYSFSTSGIALIVLETSVVWVSLSGPLVGQPTPQRGVLPFLGCGEELYRVDPTSLVSERMKDCYVR